MYALSPACKSIVEKCIEDVAISSILYESKTNIALRSPNKMMLYNFLVWLNLHLSRKKWCIIWRLSLNSFRLFWFSSKAKLKPSIFVDLSPLPFMNFILASERCSPPSFGGRVVNICPAQPSVHDGELEPPDTTNSCDCLLGLLRKPCLLSQRLLCREHEWGPRNPRLPATLIVAGGYEVCDLLALKDSIALDSTIMFGSAYCNSKLLQTTYGILYDY